jgi:hypothetical protein
VTSRTRVLVGKPQKVWTPSGGPSIAGKGRCKERLVISSLRSTDLRCRGRDDNDESRRMTRSTSRLTLPICTRRRDQPLCGAAATRRSAADSALNLPSHVKAATNQCCAWSSQNTFATVSARPGRKSLGGLGPLVRGFRTLGVRVSHFASVPKADRRSAGMHTDWFDGRTAACIVF